MLLCSSAERQVNGAQNMELLVLKGLANIEDERTFKITHRSVHFLRLNARDCVLRYYILVIASYEGSFNGMPDPVTQNKNIWIVRCLL